MAAFRRLPITLLEMIIVISILALASGIVAVNINKALVDQRFRTEVGMVVDKMRLAQDLMLILGTDVHLNFEENEKGDGINFWLDTETELPKNVKYEIHKKDKETLRTIKGVFLADELVSEIKEKYIDVKFLSHGAVMSKGIMRLATSDKDSPPKGTLQSFICLAGYPRPIVSYTSKEEADKFCTSLEDDQDERLTQDTISKLPEKLKQPDPQATENNFQDRKDTIKPKNQSSESKAQEKE